MTDKLLPCPFCGGKAELEKSLSGSFTAGCSDYKNCIGYWTCCNFYATEAEAIAAWNTRAAIEYDDWFYLPKPKQDIGSMAPPRVTSVTSKYGGYTVEAEQFIELNNRLTREWARKVGDDIIRRICKVWLEDALTERACYSTTEESAWCFACSECGKTFPRNELHLAHNHGEINYCPNCGAKVIER